MTKKRSTTDVIEILHHRFYEGHPERLAALEVERANAEIARTIYRLRTKARLSQRELAELVGTSTSVISRLEDADYEGHSLTMLRRIAKALNRRLEVRFLPLTTAK
ncbi:MAG: helix-turn-helix domain-containing protein [Gemmataceae bacterium]|nr:helix-turn-helix domain-containing protein [Gemmataceae bacterium]